MIYDEWTNRGVYRAIMPEAWRLAEELLDKAASLPDGKYELDGEKVFVTLAHYDTRDVEASKSEIHRKYVDIQLVLEGEEDIYCSVLTGAEKSAADFSGGDCALFPLEAKRCFPVRMKPGVFAVFFPEEGHAPMVTVAGKASSRVRKAVVKVAAGCLR